MPQKLFDLIKLEAYYNYDEYREKIRETFSIESIFDIIFAGDGELIAFNVLNDYDDTSPIGQVLEIYKLDNKYICLAIPDTYVQYYWKEDFIGQDYMEDIYDLLTNQKYCNVYSEDEFKQTFRKYRSFIPKLQDKIKFYEAIGQDPKVEILDEINNYSCYCKDHIY